MDGNNPLTKPVGEIAKMGEILKEMGLAQEFRKAPAVAGPINRALEAQRLENLITHYASPALDTSVLDSLFEARVEAEEAPTARRAVNQLVIEIREFESQLDDQSELGVKLAPFGGSTVLHVAEIGFQQPCLVVLVGNLEDGSPVKLIQHLSQLNFLLIRVRRLNPNVPRKPVGFRQDLRQEEQKRAG